MVVKKKKNTVKKSVKKVKKMVKKSVKSAVKKATKPPAKKSKKSVKKPTKPAKKIVKKSKPSKKNIQKPATKKTALLSVSKTSGTFAAIAPAKKSTVSSVEVRSIATSRPFIQPTPKKPMMREQSNKITGKINRDAMEDMEFIEIDTTPSKKATTLLGALEFTPYQPTADEVYMNEHQRDHFRKILNAWRQQLMQDVDLTVGHLKEDAVFYADPVDRASQEEGFNLELRTRDRERRLIKKIEQSLDLITNGEYGFCEDCGADIGIRRLEARPTAVKCIDCKTFQEIREKQLGG